MDNVIDNSKINVAYITSWKESNPNLLDIKTDGHYLFYKNKKIDIQDIYMQDILRNPNIFYNMMHITSEDLFKIIKVHVYSIKIKEKELEEKLRRYKAYEQ